MTVLERKVTIGICVRNCASTIQKAIQSIITQDYPHELMEIIIVDGCSSDGTMQIINQILRGSDISTRVYTENKGLSYARQMVVNSAKGDYIIWVDGDMILPRNFVRIQVDFMEKNPNVGVAKGKYKFFKQKSIVATLENLEFALCFQREREVSFESLGASGCIYRISALNSTGGFDLNFKGAGEDSDLEYRIKNAGWKLSISPAYFYEKRRETWQSLFKEYIWHGRGGFYIYKKYGNIAGFHQVFPPYLLFIKAFQACRAYKLIREKIAFLLPLHYILKRIAWFLGFICEFLKWHIGDL